MCLSVCTEVFTIRADSDCTLAHSVLGSRPMAVGVCVRAMHANRRYSCQCTHLISVSVCMFSDAFSMSCANIVGGGVYDGYILILLLCTTVDFCYKRHRETRRYYLCVGALNVKVESVG